MTELETLLLDSLKALSKEQDELRNLFTSSLVEMKKELDSVKQDNDRLLQYVKTVNATLSRLEESI
jgi:hypothetical protein